MESKIMFSAPWPVSLNRIHQVVHRRIILTPQARAYKTAVVDAVIRQGVPILPEADLWIEIVYFPPEGRERPDLDNLQKLLFDGFTMSPGVWVDDKYVAEKREVFAPAMGAGSIEVMAGVLIYGD